MAMFVTEPIYCGQSYYGRKVKKSLFVFSDNCADDAESIMLSLFESEGHDKRKFKKMLFWRKSEIASRGVKFYWVSHTESLKIGIAGVKRIDFFDAMDAASEENEAQCV